MVSRTPPPTPTASAPPRVLCAWLPHVPVALAEREDLRRMGRPLVVAAPEAQGLRVQDRSYAAHLAGILPGMTVTEARRLCPGLEVLPARPEVYATVFQALLAALNDISPAVEPADLAQGWLSTAGLVPRGGSEQTLADAVLAAVRGATDLDARVGLAVGKLTSRILTRYLGERGSMVLPPGKEALFLGGLPAHYLPLAAGTLTVLRELGVVKVHQYADLPQDGILARFGHAGLRAWRLAHGEDDPRVRPWAQEPVLEAVHAFPEPIANHRSLEHHIGQLAARLAGPLARQFQMAGRLRLQLDLERGQPLILERRLLTPLAGAAALTTQAVALLHQVACRAPVDRLSLAAQGLCPTTARQLNLFRQEESAQEHIEAALQRIQTRYGEAAVQQGQVLDPDAPLHERRATARAWTPQHHARSAGSAAAD